MDTSEDIAWLRVVGIHEPRLLDPGRMTQLMRDLKDPANQRPSAFLFVGSHSKNTALREIFPDNNLKDSPSNAVATCHVDNASAYSDFPILFAESSAVQVIPLMGDDDEYGEANSFPLKWAGSATVQRLHDVLHARLFCLFVDVICIFADDFDGFEGVVRMLESWASAGNASLQFGILKPKVVIVRQGDETSGSPTYDLLTIENLQQCLHSASLRDCFSSIKVLHLAARQISPLARFRRLKELLSREIIEMRQLRQSLGCLFSAEHTARFFHLAVAHTANSPSQPFDFIAASRRGNSLGSNFKDHLIRILRLGEKHGIPRDATMTYVATNIVQDAYPPRMHAFDPEVLYDSQYRHFCLQALSETCADQETAHRRNEMIREQLIKAFGQMVSSNAPALSVHWETTASLGIDWAEIKSNETCLYCVRRMPESTMSCGHAICEVCIRNLGCETSAFDCQYQIDSCNLCHAGKLLLGLRPLTAGPRLLSVDGGGTLGVIAVEFLGTLQSVLGRTWRIQDLFDIAFGTSVGGLIVLMLFLRQVPVAECVKTFDTLAQQLFPRPTTRPNLLSRIHRLTRSWYRDAWHDAASLELNLKKNLSAQQRLFGHVEAVIATKVGVTAATIDKGFPVLLTNYNGSGDLDRDSGYTIIRPSDVEDELFTWEAGRMTSAAPVLYPHVHTTATGPIQDGGMSGHNNPIKLALWESLRIDPTNTGPDVVVSIGTGTSRKPKSPIATSFRHVFLDGFIPRLWRAYMSSFDGESNYRDIVNCLSQEARSDYKRLNVVLPKNEPAIDNTSRLEELRQLVHQDPRVIKDCEETIYALLISSFYFELSATQPQARGQIRCIGMVRCRLPGEVMVGLLDRVHPSRLSFMTHGRALGLYSGKRDLCFACQRYSKFVDFIVPDVKHSISIFVSSGKRQRRKISAFPQTIQWFIDQQQMDAPFGTAYHSNLKRSCKACVAVDDTNLKRRISPAGTRARRCKKRRFI